MMGKHSSEFSLETAQHVLWHFGDYNIGVEPGSFIKSLLTTISRADNTNRDKLYSEYPQYVELLTTARDQHWGFEWLRNKVVRLTAAHSELEDVDLFLVVTK